MENNFRKTFLLFVYDLRFYTKWLNVISKWMQFDKLKDKRILLIASGEWKVTKTPYSSLKLR